MTVLYAPDKERAPDTQYNNLLARVMHSDREPMVVQGQRAKTIIGHQMRFPMKNGFPIITERDMSGKFFRAALGEHIGFLNGARTHEELKKFGCPYWHPWVTKEKCAAFGLPTGDLGDGSYGMAWTQFPTPDGRTFNQIKSSIEIFKRMPYLRTNRITSWIPHYMHTVEGFDRRVVVAPCHGEIHVRGFPETKELIILHWQRSADSPVGLAFNLIQYAAFGMMFAQVVGYTFVELVYQIADAHIYEMQYPYVRELLMREPRKFPTVKMDANITNIFDFRPEHFEIEDYDPHPAMTIPTPV